MRRKLLVWIFGAPSTLKTRLERGVVSAIPFTLVPLAVLALVEGHFFVLAVSGAALAAFAFAAWRIAARRSRRRPVLARGIHSRPSRARRVVNSHGSRVRL